MQSVTTSLFVDLVINKHSLIICHPQYRPCDGIHKAKEDQANNPSHNQQSSFIADLLNKILSHVAIRGGGVLDGGAIDGETIDGVGAIDGDAIDGVGAIDSRRRNRKKGKETRSQAHS